MAGALLAGGIQQARVSSAQTGLAQVREQHAQAVADAALAKAAAHARALEIERELTARTQAGHLVQVNAGAVRLLDQRKAEAALASVDNLATVANDPS